MNGCTTLLAGRGVRTDGSVLAALHVDRDPASWLALQPRESHASGASVPICSDRQTEKRGVAVRVRQVAGTAQGSGTDRLPAMNEHGVGTALNACRSRRALARDMNSCSSHLQLLRIALEGATTARGTIRITGSLVEGFGPLDIGPLPSGKNIGEISADAAEEVPRTLSALTGEARMRLAGGMMQETPDEPLSDLGAYRA